MRETRNDDRSGSDDYLDGENLPDDELCPLPPAGSETSFFERGSLPEPGQTMTRTVEDSQSGWRLDLFLAHFYPQYSRVLIRRAIQAEGVDVSGRHGKPSYRLRPGEVVSFTLPELPRQSPIPEDIPLEILYEDDVLAVINKPANMVVHPSRGHWAGTLVGALAYRYAGQLSTVRGPGRPGIVHRLDRDTSGVIWWRRTTRFTPFWRHCFRSVRFIRSISRLSPEICLPTVMWSTSRLAIILKAARK